MQWCLPYLLCLACLLVGGQKVRRQCPPPEECRLMAQCPHVFQQYNETKKLDKESAEYLQLLKRLKEKVCDSVAKKVCCDPVTREISGAIGPTDPHEFPFMVRLTIWGAHGLKAHCGASLIAPKFLATAYHCFYNANPDIQFERDCVQPGSCYATIAEHDISRTDLEEHNVDIKAVFRPLTNVDVIDLRSESDQEDLAIVELDKAVILNERVKLVKVSQERLMPGDVVTTLGWGLAFQRGQPDELLKAQLNVSDVDLTGGLDYTEVGSNSIGIPVDTCSGDSGGPLLGWRDNKWYLFSTLQGGGYNCLTDRTRGDGVWNSVAANYDWVQQVITGVSEEPDNSNLEPIKNKEQEALAAVVGLYDALWETARGLVISSTGGASEYVGNVLGEYVKKGFSGGRPYFKQRDTVGQQTEFFLYYNDSQSCQSWLVGNSLGPCNGYLTNNAVQGLTYPPVSSWKYWSLQAWQDDDPTLNLRQVAEAFNSAALTPCREVVVRASGLAAAFHDRSLGSYTPSGEWMEGRPVYVKLGGEESRYLMVAEGKTSWSVRTAPLGKLVLLESGRGTNSPGDPGAGPSVRLGVREWRFWNPLLEEGGSLEEGEITVTCK